MAEKEGTSSIADASRPNAGRIYDYLLGGSHNFEIDRIAAKQLMSQSPDMPKWVRLVRWFLGEAVRRLLEEGFTKFVDFASGLPTVDHIHQIAPKGTVVVYSDLDPVTVAYGQEIVKNLPGVTFVFADAGEPEKLLKLEVVQKLIGKERKVAIGFNGIAFFLPDEKIAHAMQVLYDWAEPGSKLFFCDIEIQVASEMADQTDEFYAKLNQPVFRRTRSKLIELLGRWRVCDPGMQPLQQWLPIDKTKMEEGVQRMGGNLIGAIVEKQ
jgi:SAM-dependent methyltransferase